MGAGNATSAGGALAAAVGAGPGAGRAPQTGVRIVVAAHKPYWMPADPMYVPVQAGAALAAGPIPGFRRDDEGPESISADNPRYCELTALYWAWKNLDADYLGLAHYRRHFSGAGERGTMTSPEAEALLRRAPVVLPTRRNYYIETIESHYGHTFDPAHVELLRGALAECSPECLPAFERNMARRSAHMFNVFLMRRDLADAYCGWLFAALRRVEGRIDFSDMTPFEARCMGRLSERLLDTWLDANGVSYAERKVVDMEPVNWAKKGGSFLAAKFMGRKYVASF